MRRYEERVDFNNKEINEEPHTKFDVFDLKLWKFKKGKIVKDYNFYSYLSEWKIK